MTTRPVFTYIAAVGITKAAANWFTGTLLDRYGCKPLLVIGWLVALPVPVLLILAPTWWWVVASRLYETRPPVRATIPA